MKKNKIITYANYLLEVKSLHTKPIPGQLSKIYEELTDTGHMPDVAKEELLWRWRQLLSRIQQKELRSLKSKSIYEIRTLKP